jgi:gas vesicle protein
MNNINWLYAFIGGAILGAGVAILFAPEKGEDIVRSHMKI